MKNGGFKMLCYYPAGKYKISFLSSLLLVIVILPEQVVFGQIGDTLIEQRLEAPSLPSEKGLIICTIDIKLLADTNAVEFENWVAAYWNEEWKDLIPEIQSFVSKNTSEESGNIYTYFLIFKSNRIHRISLAAADDNTEWFRE